MQETINPQLPYLLALNRMPRMSTRKIVNIFEKVSDLSLLLSSKEGLLQAAEEFGIQEPVDWAGVEADLAWSNQKDCHIVSFFDSSYPALLKQISGAPPILFLKGNKPLLCQPQIAIVGSRNPTPSGFDTAYEFARSFSSQGLIITSGLALGIDSAAHRGALAETGKTIAVFGNGLNYIYPEVHRTLAESIVASGLLVSEFPIDHPPRASYFPRRNRVISGLSLGTLVVEAALKSGSLVTAHLAANQGREVFAIPGSIHSPLSKGCHQLIKEGAKLVETAADVLEELNSLMLYTESNQDFSEDPLGNLRNGLGEMKVPGVNKQVSLLKNAKKLPKELKQLLKYMAMGSGVSFDYLALKTGLTSQRVSSMMLELELMGCVIAVPGGYTRV